MPRTIFEECKWYTSIFDTWELGTLGIDLTRLIIIHSLFIAWSSYTADIQKLVESLGFSVHLYADSFMSPAKPCRRLIWLAMPCASSTRSKSGCHWTVFSRMKIRLRSLGWAQVASSESGICRRLMLSCRPPMSWAISESTLTQNWLRIIELAFKRVSMHAGPHLHKSSWSLNGSHSYSRLAAVCTEFSCSFGCEHRKIQRNLGCHLRRITLAANQEAHWI